MSDDKKRIDAPDLKSVGSRNSKGPIPKEPIEGSAGEETASAARAATS